MTVLGACALLFLSAFLSATLLPGSSEATLIALLASKTGTPRALIAAASLGNVAGALVNWGLAVLPALQRPDVVPREGRDE